MDKKNAKLKNNITQMIGQLSKIYKEISSKENDSYLLGKKEAYEEILNWFLHTHSGDFRYVSANNFFTMIQEKLNKVKIAINKQNEEAEEEIINIKDLRDLKQINFSDLKINDNRKRINRFAQDQSNDELNYQENSNNNIQFSLINPFLSYPNNNGSNSQNNLVLNINNNSVIANNNPNVHASISNNNNFGCGLTAANNLIANSGTLDHAQGNSFNAQNPFLNMSNNSVSNNCNNPGFNIGNNNNSVMIPQINSFGNNNNNSQILNLNQINQQANFSSNSNSNNSSLSKKRRK